MRSTSTKALTTVLAVVLAVVLWWWQGNGDGPEPTDGPSFSATPGESAADPGTPGASPSASPSSTPHAPTSPPPAGSSPTVPSSAPSAGAPGRTGIDPASGLPWVAVEELPVEAEETLLLIDDGGPFPHDRDGITFGNYEGILPQRPRGYYAEYTVPTPGISHRGARRIVTGDGGEYYWTEDHYESFERIDW